MTNRITAALTALTLCIGITGCGKTEEDGAASSGGSADKAITKQENSSETGDEASDDSESEEMPDEVGKTSNGEFVIDPTNIVYTADNVTYMPTNEEAAKFISLALEQYRAAYDGDVQKYMDLMNPGSIIEPLGTIADELYTETSDVKYLAKNLALSLTMEEIYYLMEKEQTNLIDGYDGSEDLAVIARTAIESIDVTAPKASEELGSIIKEVQAAGTLGNTDENTVVYMKIACCDREGDDIYIVYDMWTTMGDYSYELREVSSWCVNGQWGVFSGSELVEENPCKGMSSDEIKEYITQQLGQAESEAAAHTAYIALEEFVWDTMTLQDIADGKKVMAEFFDAVTSEKGLDLSAGSPSLDGDKQIYTALINEGYTSGIITLIGDDPISDNFFVCYTSTDGAAVHYPLK